MSIPKWNQLDDCIKRNEYIFVVNQNKFTLLLNEHELNQISH